MHGLGKRASSHSVTNYSSNTEETVSSGGCDASVRLAELQERVRLVQNGSILVVECHICFSFTCFAVRCLYIY